MKSNSNIKIMYAISLLEGMVFYGAIATLYRQAIGISVFQITIIESISMVLAIALELLWGVLAEKIGYKNAMIFCSIIYVISKIIFWKADGFGMLLFERILLSIVIPVILELVRVYCICLVRKRMHIKCLVSMMVLAPMV